MAAHTSPSEAPAQVAAGLCRQGQGLATMPRGLLICTNRHGLKKKNWKGAIFREKDTRLPLIAVGPEATSPLSPSFCLVKMGITPLTFLGCCGNLRLQRTMPGGPQVSQAHELCLRRVRTTMPFQWGQLNGRSNLSPTSVNSPVCGPTMPPKASALLLAMTGGTESQVRSVETLKCSSLSPSG